MLAPFSNNLLEPTPRKEVIFHGVTKMGLFSFIAVLAVLRAPLFSGASITIKAFEIEAISRFLFKNEKGCGGTSGKYSLIIAPPDSKI